MYKETKVGEEQKEGQCDWCVVRREKVAENNMAGYSLSPSSVGSLNYDMNFGLILKQWDISEEFKTQDWYNWSDMFFKVPLAALAYIDWNGTKVNSRKLLRNLSPHKKWWGLHLVDGEGHGNKEDALKIFFSGKTQEVLVMDWKLGVNKGEPCGIWNSNHCYFSEVILFLFSSY